MDEFFVISKFQGKNIGEIAAQQIWNKHQGVWEVAIILENKKALSFWHKAISNYTNIKFSHEEKVVNYDQHQPKRIIFTFSTKHNNNIDSTEILEIDICSAVDDDIIVMVEISKIKRLNYEKSQPQFWKYAGNIAEQVQCDYFKKLVKCEKHSRALSKL